MKMEILFMAGIVQSALEKVVVGVCVRVCACLCCSFGVKGAVKLPELCAKELHYQVKDA